MVGQWSVVVSGGQWSVVVSDQRCQIPIVDNSRVAGRRSPFFLSLKNIYIIYLKKRDLFLNNSNFVPSFVVVLPDDRGRGRILG